MSRTPKITQVSGRAVPVRGNDIDTDRIIPARYLKEITFSRMGEFPFYDERFDPSGNSKPHAFNDPKYRGAGILFVNKNFGCGSSREHAPQALSRWGIQAIVGESFAAIFAGNCVAIGLPTVVVSTEQMESLMHSVESTPETLYTVDLHSKKLSFGELQIALDMPESHRKALIEGTWDSTSMLSANLEKVRAVASRLPYIRGFSG